MAKTEQELLNEGLNKKIDVEIKTTDDEQIFALVLAQMLIDCHNEPQFKAWLDSDKLEDKMKAGLSMARPILCSFMFAKENQAQMQETKKYEQSGQDIIKS